MVSAAFKWVLQQAETTFAFPSVFIGILCTWVRHVRPEVGPGWNQGQLTKGILDRPVSRSTQLNPLVPRDTFLLDVNKTLI